MSCLKTNLSAKLLFAIFFPLFFLFLCVHLILMLHNVSLLNTACACNKRDEANFLSSFFLPKARIAFARAVVHKLMSPQSGLLDLFYKRSLSPMWAYLVYSCSSFCIASTFFASSLTIDFISVSSVDICASAFVEGLSFSIIVWKYSRPNPIIIVSTRPIATRIPTAMSVSQLIFPT